MFLFRGLNERSNDPKHVVKVDLYCDFSVHESDKFKTLYP